MPAYIKGIQSPYCGVTGFTVFVSMDNDNNADTFPVPPIPLAPGDWNVAATVTAFTPGDPEDSLQSNMVRVRLRQQAWCGVLEPELGADTITLKEIAFQFPCLNGLTPEDPACVGIIGAPVPYAPLMVPYILENTYRDCCTGHGDFVYFTIDDAAVECPVTDCTLHVLQVDVFKNNGMPFSIAFNLECERILAPP